MLAARLLFAKNEKPDESHRVSELRRSLVRGEEPLLAMITAEDTGHTIDDSRHLRPEVRAQDELALETARLETAVCLGDFIE